MSTLLQDHPDRTISAAMVSEPAGAGALPPARSGLRTHHRFLPFHRFLYTVLAGNLIFAVAFFTQGPSWNAILTATLTAASVNIGLAALVREQYFVNALFKVITKAPLRWPLRARAALAQVHHVGGGVHVGAAMCATVWFAVYTGGVFISRPSASGTAQYVAILAVVSAILAVLLGMALCARPAMREKHHDLFEATHRYGGWLALVLFAALTVLHASAAAGPAWSDILASPNTWILLMLFVFTAIPWLQLRRVPVRVVNPSSHVSLVSFDHGHVHTGSASRIARHPLGQWHAFANMTFPDRDGYRIAVSRAGEWTSTFIADQPSHVWVKGVPTTGVGSVARMFKRVVWITTGSGIAPALPHLLNDPTPAQLVWVTRNPERTYGHDLVGEIFAAQPDAILWDTDAHGKPDLTELAYRAMQESGAEAVICISNKKATLKLVRELQERGIPAFGPIWDS